MATKINARLRHKRGTETSIPTLVDGQIYLCTDTHKIYKGTSTGENILIGDIVELEKLKTKDLRSAKHFTDNSIFSPTLGVSHECWNKWVSVEGNNMENAPHTGALWCEVFTGGTDTRAFQICVSVFSGTRKIYVRYKHDSAWSEFRFIATGFLKEMTLLNGWVKLDMTPTLSLNGNTLTVNARIKSGVTSANTLIAETGLFASSGGSTFHNCYTPTGQLLGTLVYTSEGTIKIFNELSSNADVCFNFSVSVNSL